MDKIEENDLLKLRMVNDKLNEQIQLAADQLEERRAELEERFEDKKNKLTQGDDLAPGVLKIVKVYLAIKRRIQPGDKMAGRHGNKESFQSLCRWKTCLMMKTENLLT